MFHIGKIFDRIGSFEIDYKTWTKTVQQIELDMQQFVKTEMQQFHDNLCPGLLLLKRFENLKLDCLCLDRRYLDLAIWFANELQSLKDT